MNSINMVQSGGRRRRRSGKQKGSKGGWVSVPPVKRTDPMSNTEHTKGEFFGLYGRDTEWEAARPADSTLSGGGGKKRRSGKKRKASKSFLAAGKSWRAHLSQYRKAHPNLSLKQQMKGASKTYKKGSSAVTVRTSKYDVQVKSRKGAKRKTKRAKKRSSKKRSGLFGF
jgi:hypothetical protein